MAGRARWRRHSEPIDVLVVCTGNVCRSPMIATVLSVLLPDLNVRSAGTAAPVGEPWHPLALRALAERGHVVTGNARQLRASDVRAAKLILTAEGAHRADVVRLDPTAEERCYTLFEASRLLTNAPVDGARGPHGVATRLAVALRDQRDEYDDDLVDPLSEPLAAFRTCLGNIESALDILACGLRPQ